MWPNDSTDVTGPPLWLLFTSLCCLDKSWRHFHSICTESHTNRNYLVAQKHVIFSEKMNRESESFSPTESVKQSRTKVIQSEIKEEDSRWALHLCFSLSGWFWKAAAAVSYSLIPSSALPGLIKNRGALFISETLLLRILEMRSSEACRPHKETEHMSRYRPTEQRIPQTISP